MIISLIAAIDQNNLIGNGSKIPWKLPADLKYFKSMTIGKPVVMGRKTFETLKQPLRNRLNIILTKNKNYYVPKSCLVAHSIEEAIAIGSDYPELMVCGGSPVYRAFLPKANRFYLTQIHATFKGDIYFPSFDITEWTLIKKIDHEPNKKNFYPYSFLILEKSIKNN